MQLYIESSHCLSINKWMQVHCMEFITSKCLKHKDHEIIYKRYNMHLQEMSLTNGYLLLWVS